MSKRTHNQCSLNKFAHRNLIIRSICITNLLIYYKSILLEFKNKFFIFIYPEKS